MVNWKDTKYKTINDIKNEKKADGTGFFTPEELTYFDDPLIENKLNNAASVAELVEEVQKGETATKKEQALSTKLNSEKTNGTVAFRVVNRRPNYRVDNAIFRLSLYLGNSERTKAERETRVTEIDKKIAENNLQRASKEKVKRGMELTLGEALEEKSRMEKVHKINNNLQVVLTGAGKLITADKPDGVDISTLTDLYKVKDYSIGDNVHKDDSTTITDIYGGATGNTVTNILDHAKSFLGKVKDLKASLGNKKFFIPTSLSLYNDRKINCKNNISNGLDEFGIMYLSVLRSIGSEKLEKVIAASGSSKKTKLEKNIKKITKYISKIEANVGEELTIKQITDYAFGQKAVEYADKQERNAQNFLKSKPSELCELPDWKAIFEFMKEVFPLKTGTTSYELAAKPYLDDINDANFLKPSTTGDKGWKDLTLCGYSFNPKEPSLNDSQKALIKTQHDAKNIESDTDFKTLTKMWWEIFGPFMENKTDSDLNDWGTGHKASAPDNNITNTEAIYAREVECLKYCRTMRELFLEMKISSSIDEYDEHLIKISQEALRGRIIFPDRSKIIERAKLISDHAATDAIALAAQNNEIWKDVGKWEDYASTKLFKTSSLDLRAAQHRVDSLTTKINDLEMDVVSLTMENKDLEAEKKLLEGWKDFDSKDLPGKKDAFETLYKKGKWTWNEVTQMLSFLKTIKTEMNDDTAFIVLYLVSFQLTIFLILLFYLLYYFIY